MSDVDPRVLAGVENIAAGLAEPTRSAETRRHYAKLLAAMNSSHDANGEQDTVTVYEALAMLIGQLIGGMEDTTAECALDYIHYRARLYSDEARKLGTYAAHCEEILPTRRPS